MGTNFWVLMPLPGDGALNWDCPGPEVWFGEVTWTCCRQTVELPLACKLPRYRHVGSAGLASGWIVSERAAICSFGCPHLPPLVTCPFGLTFRRRGLKRPDATAPASANPSSNPR
jgi:hypothetical protein